MLPTREIISKLMLTLAHLLARRQRHGSVRLSQRPCFDEGAREGGGFLLGESGENSAGQMVFGRRDGGETRATFEGLVQGCRVRGRLEAVSGWKSILQPCYRVTIQVKVIYSSPNIYIILYRTNFYFFVLDFYYFRLNWLRTSKIKLFVED